MDYEKIFDKETPTNTPKTWAYFKYGSTGSFAIALCRAWELADLDNRRRLELAFPRLFNTALSRERAENPGEYLIKIMKGK
mgnify:CR=1 FL=1